MRCSLLSRVAALLNALALLGVAASFGAAAARAAPAEHFSVEPFGEVTLYRGSSKPKDVVLFVSGDGGWNLGVISMAQRVADKGAVVAGIDIRHFLAQLENSPEACVSPDMDLQNLSRYVQSKLDLEGDLQPTLVGYSSGATLVYATLAQAAEDEFKGALSIGFCPDLDLRKPLCAGAGIESTPRNDAQGNRQGVNFLPAKKLSGKWISLQGELDEVCPAPAAKRFIDEVPGSEVISLPKVGHGYAVTRNWAPQFEAAYKRITAPPASSSMLPAQLADLPLIIVPAAAGPASPWFSVLLSGDGGWAALDRGVSKEFAKHQIPVVGWDSLKYFWAARTPQGISTDLDRVLRYYAAEWHKTRAVLIGYSQGADTMPFMVNRLPAATHDLVGYTALLGLSDNAVFQIHVSSWFGKASGTIPTAPELEHWTGTSYLCLYGEGDKDAACNQLVKAGGEAVKLPGGHHFGGNYAALATEILERMPAP